jgi:hypothetical protein
LKFVADIDTSLVVCFDRHQRGSAAIEVDMGLFKLWREARAVAASGVPAAQSHQSAQGMMVGLAGAMLKVMGPFMAVQSPERGKPLPGTEPGVLDPQEPDALQAATLVVRARDSAFDLQVLTTFVNQLFAALSSALGTGDTSTVRGLLSDELWEPLSATLTSGMGAGFGAVYSHQTGQATLTGLWAGTWYDTALFNFAVHVDLSRDGKHPIPPEFMSWTEDWLVQRSVQPGGDPMIVADTCPSCGAPTALDAGGHCTHCRQPVPVLTTGWLVTCIRSHNPAVETFREEMVSNLREHPETLKMFPDEIVKQLPADAVRQVDPQRAAALGLGASR